MPYPVGLVGESNYQAAIRQCSVGERVEVLHETGNPYDAHALVVCSPAFGKLGYVPRSSWLRAAIHDEGQACDAAIQEIRTGADGMLGVVIAAAPGPGAIGRCAY